MSFKRLGLSLPLVKWAERMGYTDPTPIQDQAIPKALSGRDIIGCAQTGTGKTAAFIMPTLQRVSKKNNIKALVVTPTRELATQIEEVARSCANYTGHKVLAVYGGVPYAPQGRKVRQGIDVLIATPGRLLDMMNRGDVNISSIEVFVLDEADRMLDMGFMPDIKRLIKELPEVRQTMLFSATMPQEILNVIDTTLKDPVMIQIGRKSTPAQAIKQLLYPVSAMQKSDLLCALLEQRELDKVLIFTRTKRRADMVAKVLVRRGISTEVMHSDRSQRQRQDALAMFRRGRIRVLVATDIVARGIDVDNISHVVNFDMPTNPEDYIHRVGRTARAEANGIAISLFAGEEFSCLRDIERLIGQSIPHVKLDGFEYEKHFIPGAHRTKAAAPKPGVKKLVFDGGARRSTSRKQKRR